MAAILITILQIVKWISTEMVYLVHRHMIINGQPSTLKEFLCI